MVVALKSLPPGTMLNIVGFGTTIKALFTSSKLCNDTVACSVRGTVCSSSSSFAHTVGRSVGRSVVKQQQQQQQQQVSSPALGCRSSQGCRVLAGAGVCRDSHYTYTVDHMDIMSSPVLMLNFCPDLLAEPLELHRATRELVFLIDRSGSMSGANIHRVKEGMVVALKSLPPGTMLNIVGFGTTIKALFTSSKLCNDEGMVVALKSLPPGTMLNIVGFGTTIKALFTSSKLCNDTVACSVRGTVCSSSSSFAHTVGRSVGRSVVKQQQQQQQQVSSPALGCRSSQGCRVLAGAGVCRDSHYTYTVDHMVTFHAF
ncbi:hypothetical protein CRUP_015888 [Coryphaenoides rupestris]|nr:hypothetical protein CRUP_015888 [Coryphaenoides rupestris]